MPETAITTQSLAKQLIEKEGSISAAARKAKIFRSTLKRIIQGHTDTPHMKTFAKLAKALNAK